MLTTLPSLWIQIVEQEQSEPRILPTAAPGEQSQLT